MSSYLTKSKFKLAFECPTKLFYVDKVDYANQQLDDSFLKALAEGGVQVGSLAQCYHPGGVLIETEDNDSALSLTQELLLKDSATLFEAAIKYDSFFIRIDILVKNKNHLKLIEVKTKSCDANTQADLEKQKGKINANWKPYIADVAFQKWVLQNAYPNCRISAYLMLINKDSLCPTDGLNQKFLLRKNESGRVKVRVSEKLSAEDLSVHLLKEINVDNSIEKIWDECDENGLSFKERFKQFSQYYFEGKKVTPVPKKACGKCQYKTCPDDEKHGLKSGFKECWREALHYTDSDFTDPTVLDLWSFLKKDPYLKKGLIKLKDFHESDLNIRSDDMPGISASERQWLQISKVKDNDNRIWMDENGLRDEISSWIYPLHFIDFETAMLPIPFKKGAHPYQGIAFQFSHHILNKNGDVRHYGEYLNTEPGVDPGIEFIRALKKDLEIDNGTIFRYSNHENTFLNMLLKQLQEFSDTLPDKEELCTFIKSITKSSSDSPDKRHGERCMVDLWELVKRFYYDPLTNGSNSIKKIFPSLLQHSEFLQHKYDKPIYGAAGGIPSKNFKNKQWIIIEQNRIKDPYSLLEPINKGVPEDQIELLFENTQLNEGGSATIAYAKLQYTEMSDFERNELRKALLGYCELDTLAMVMIVEGWLDILGFKTP